MTRPSSQTDPQRRALASALRAVLRPLADLAISQGLPYAALEELLKHSLVESAREAQPDPTAPRRVSRISTATGLSRREVTRLCAEEAPAEPAGRSLASELFTHWTTAPDYRDAQGNPLALPRLGAAPSFETLAHWVTRDVHPRSLLEELLRLGLAEHDGPTDTVRLRHRNFVPRGDAARMLGFLGDNVGDHLRAAVHNVLADGPPHFEQAVFADELSSASIQAARALVRSHWQALLESLVPQLERLVAEDEARQRVRHQRLRIGLYSYHEAMAPPAADPSGDAPSAHPQEDPT